jgi:hypothetical protein
MITFTLTGAVDVLAQLETRRAALFGALVERINYWDLMLQQRIQRKLSGEVLHQRSGKLKRSIEVIPAVVDEAAGAIAGKVVGAGGPAWYGKLHEYGTPDRTYTIYPVTKKALRFIIDGKVIFAKSVTVTRGTKERSFMRSSLAELKPDVLAGLQETVYRVLSAQP